MEKKIEIDVLIKSFYLGTITNEEMIFLLDYLKEKEPQHEVLRFYQNAWDTAVDFNNDLDSKRLYNQIVNRIGVSKPEKESSNGIKSIGMFSLVLRYAAVFILAFGLSWLIRSYFWNKPEPILFTGENQNQTIEVPYGSKTSVHLPDGSIVQLNSGSSLQFSASDFNSGSRSVFLKGEAFFNVTKNPDLPFYVNTPGLKLKVLGTTFNVKAYPDEISEEALLVIGKVEIYKRSDQYEKGKVIVLLPNQKAIFLKSEQQVVQVDSATVRSAVVPIQFKAVQNENPSKTEQTISWKDNKLIFDNETFMSLAIKLERWYDVKISVNYPELNSIRFSGKFDKETLEQVLNAFNTIIRFNYSIKQNQITISKKYVL